MHCFVHIKIDLLSHLWEDDDKVAFGLCQLLLSIDIIDQ